MIAPTRVTLNRVCSAGLLSLVLFAASVSAAIADKREFKIEAQDAATALTEFGRQAGVQILFEYDLVKGRRTNAVWGELEPKEAIRLLVEGTGLRISEMENGVLIVEAGQHPPRKAAANQPYALAQVETTHAKQPAEEEQSNDKATAKVGPEIPRTALPEVFVEGSRVLNMDIPRSREDAQPYVIFDRVAIERSGAINIQDFLKQKLPMNAQGVVSTQGGSDSRSLVNLRGLGTNQTLILVDGHRVASAVTTANTPQQFDLNGIPLAAIERIEVLPTTASGIYGGSATGGVINVILRRDYAGMEARVTYDNSFDSDTSLRRVDLSAGFNLEGGRTNVLLAGSYADANQLAIRDRDFVQRGRAVIMANNPAAFINSFNPPLGATTNIRSADGSPLFGPGTPGFTSVPTGYGGGGGLAPLQTNAGQYNLDLANSAQLFGGGTNGLSAGSTLKSLIATVRREFGSHVRGFLDLSASENTGESVNSRVTSSSFSIPATATNNPFGQAIRVTVPVIDGEGVSKSESVDRRVVGGVIVRLPKEWSAAADYTWNRSHFEFTNSSQGLSGAVAAQIASGSLDVLRDTNEFPIDFSPFLTPPPQFSPFVATSKNAVLRLAGPVGSLPAGAPTLTGMIEHREDVLDKAQQALPAFNLTLFFPSRSQSVDSVYVEARVPFASSNARTAGVEELELQLAARYDEYTVNGATGVTFSPTDPVERVTNKRSSTNPTVALRYKPISDVTFRASYGTGFLPPAVQQLTRGPPFPSTVIDPRRGGETRIVQVTSGGNPDLLPEDSESWSAGIIIAPRVIPGLRLSVDWTRITKTDNIIVPFGAPQAAVNNESLVPDLVTREPAPPGDPFGVGPITTVDTSLRNIARAEVEAYDVALDYRVETAGAGAFNFSALMTWQPHYQTQLIPGAPVEEKVGISSSNPQKFRGNAQLTWEYGPWLLGWAGTHFDSYALDNSLAIFGPAFDFVRSQGATHVPSQIYHDFFSSYRFPPASANAGYDLLADVEVQFGVRNVFNTMPPLDVSNSVSFYSFLGDARLASYYLSIQKSF